MTKSCRLSLLMLLFLGTAFLNTSCSMKSQPIMTISGFQQTHVGMSEKNLIKNYGPPHEVTHLNNGVVIYEYVERFYQDNRVLQIRRYVFYIKEGKVISKQMRLYDRPGYDSKGELN